MKALTVRQPYASRIVLGMKRVENRSRTTYMRGTVLAHAGGIVHEHYRPGSPDAELDGFPLSAIVGKVDVIGSHSAALCDRESCKRGGGFWPGATLDNGATIPDWPLHHWVLANAVRFDEPIPATGSLGFWQPGFEVREAVAKAVQR